MAYGKRRRSFQSGGPNKIRRLTHTPSPPKRSFVSRIRGAVRAGEIISSAARTLVNQRRKMSKTATKTTRNRSNDDVNQQAEGMVFRDCGVVTMYKRKPHHGKLLGTYRYTNLNNWVMQANQGLQVVDYPEVLLSRDMLIGNVSNIRNNRTQIPDDLFKLNPFYQLPTSTIYTAPTPDPNDVTRSDNLYIMNCKVRLQMLSMVQYPQTVKVYWMTPVHDTLYNPIDSWSGLNDSKRLGQVNQAVSSTLAQTTATAGFATITDVGSNPFHHREFKNHWRALKANHITLQAGEQVDLKIKFDYEKIINRETLAIRNVPFLKGLTVFPVVIVYAGLVGIATDSPTKCAEVAYGKPRVGLLMNQIYTFGALPRSRFSTARTYDGNIAGSAQAVKIIDDEDEIINVTEL